MDRICTWTPRALFSGGFSRGRDLELLQPAGAISIDVNLEADEQARA